MDMTRPNSGNFFVRQATAIAIGTVSLLMLLAALSFWQQEKASTEARGWLVHTYAVISQIELLLSKLQDAELGQRAYLLTGSEEYLEPYLDALRDGPGSNAGLPSPSPRAMGPGKDASPQLTELGPGVADATLRQHRSIAQQSAYIRQLTADNPAQQGNLDEMDDVIRKLLDYEASMIQARRTQDARAT